MTQEPEHYTRPESMDIEEDDALSTDSAGEAAVPPPSKQRELITEERLQQPLKVGDFWYVVSASWMEQWGQYVGLSDIQDDSDEKTEGNSELPPGPIDNSALIDTQSDGSPKLLKHVQEYSDYTLVPEDVWELLHKWYGGGPAIRRQVIDQTGDGYASLELHPYFLQVALYKTDTEEKKAEDHTTVVGNGEQIDDLDKIDDSSDEEYQEVSRTTLEFREVVTSRKTTVKQLQKQIMDTFGIEGSVSHENARLWRAFRSNPYTIIGGNSSDDDNDDDGDENNDIELTVEDLFPGREVGCQLVLEVRDSFSSEWPLGYKELERKKQQQQKRGDTSSDMFGSTRFSSHYSGSSLTSSLGTSSYFSDGNGRASPPGVCGLSNLGNTCFMNSALQCLTKTPNIRQYFITDTFRQDINRTNPLGMGGMIASAFGNLMKSMWSGKNSVITPREFKQTIGRFAPQFSGYQQQDSQELTAYLLDGLHEDLNRVKDKPLTNQVESNGRPDHVVAEEAWNVHLKRNDSIIVDIFQGQLKSTLVCPNQHEADQSNVSVTFDPFMYLSLPLPTEKSMVVPLTFYAHGGRMKPVKLAVTVNKDGTCKDLREKISKLVCADATLSPDNIVLADIFNHKVYRYYSDLTPVSTIRDNDVINAYEVQDLPEGCHSLYGSSTSYGSISRNDSKRPFASIKLRSEVSSFSYGTAREEDVLEPLVVSIDRNRTTVRDLYDQTIEFIKHFVDPEKAASLNLDELKDLVPKSTSQDRRAMADEDDESVPMIQLRTDTFASNDDGPLIYGDTLVDPNPEQRQNGDENEGGNAIDDGSDKSTLYRSHNSYYSSSQSSIKDYVLWIHPKLFETLNLRKEHVQPVIHPSVSEALERSDRGVTLSDCLDLFTSSEKLGPEDPWYCSKCKEFVQATKKFDIWKLPSVLVIHLKRFQYNRYTRDKLDTFVDFPIDELDMTPHVPPESLQFQKHLKYELFGVSNHMGGLGGGHYTAYAKIDESGKWYLFDDSYVSETSALSVKSSSAYLLFYRAVDST